MLKKTFTILFTFSVLFLSSQGCIAPDCIESKNCGTQNTCIDGTCQHKDKQTQCSDACKPTEKKCESNASFVCQKVGDCFAWKETQQCDENSICNEGSCQTCEKTCPLQGPTCSKDGLQACKKVDGCFVVETKQCETGTRCRSGRCEKTCQSNEECQDGSCFQGTCFSTKPWSKVFSGKEVQLISDIVVSKSNEIFVIGRHAPGALFGKQKLDKLGKEGIFVAKLSSDGEVLWILSGGSEEFSLPKIKLNSKGEVVFVTAFTGTFQIGDKKIASKGDFDIAIAAISQQGKLLWASGFGGPGEQMVSDLALHKDDSISIAGANFSGFKIGQWTLKARGGKDGFIAKFSPQGKLVSVFDFGGNYADAAIAIAVDAKDNIYLTGFIGHGSTFGTVNNASKVRWSTFFVAKLDKNNNILWYNRTTTDNDIKQTYSTGHEIRLVSQGDVVVSGYFYGSQVLGKGTYDGIPVRSVGNDDLFVARFTSAGATLWVKTFGTRDDDNNTLLTQDNQGNLWALLTFQDYPKVLGKQSLDGTPSSQLYLVRIDKDGEVKAFSNLGGNNPLDYFYKIAFDQFGNLYGVGSVKSYIQHGSTKLIPKVKPSTFLLKFPLETTNK